MKIRIKGDGHSFCIGIPTGLIFSKPSVWLYLKIARKTCAAAGRYVPEHAEELTENWLDKLPDEAVFAICEELRRIKRKHGTWELVNVESSSGDLVKITL